MLFCLFAGERDASRKKTDVLDNGRGAWAAFVGTWTTGVAFTTSTIFYQAARFELHPLQSSLWIGGLVLFGALVVV